MSYEILPYINIPFSGHEHDVHNIILLPKLIFQKTKNIYGQNKESLFSMFFLLKNGIQKMQSEEQMRMAVIFSQLQEVVVVVVVVW